ncbi:hypothetical protein AB6A40_004868 [Gnathostoma spinigerum]|uniref:Mediator complex subunit Med12 LCEWAV-domain domain-containing protein n=1 Tax=Gnathostoma spinigerum TaxID=75299 RepID=A0ABD6EJ49_9BILA
MDQSVRQNLAQFMDSSNTAVKGDFGCQFGMPPESPNQHPLLGPNVTCHERLLIHLPIPQTDEYRSECNQRLLLLHGIGEQREIAKNELKKLARDITKIWTKRIVAEFSFSKPLETRIKKRTNPDQISEILHRFGCQTYYDQVVVCGWCCDNFIAMVSDFAEGHSSVMPTAEGLDILLGLMEECRNIYGIMEFAEELLDVLVHVETVIQEQRADCLPSNPSSHLAYVLAAYLSHNYYYFIHCENAPEIVNGLYRVVESQLKSPEACLTGWGRSIAVFVLHAKKQLIEADSTHKKMLGSWEVLKRVLPPWKPSAAVSNAKFNARLFPTFLSESKRLFKFTEYRQYVALIDGPDARYSFVISALITAVQCGNDYDRLVELANICGHVSAQVPISTEWCCAIQALCCSCVSGNHGFADLLLSINVEDSRCHWNIATFYMLLAARNCFSMNALFHQLLHTALSSLLKSDSAKADVDADPGVCLALLVLADMVCQNDEPVVLSDAYKGEGGSHKHVSGQADRWILSIGHLYDVGDAIFELLCTICVLADYTRNKLRDQIDDRGDAGFRLENISHLSRAVLMAMCEQDWVTLRVYRFCEETNMDVFNSHRLKKNCLGQQLLRMALRRKCERSIVQELTVCNGNSKKSLIDKLFSVLNIWNMRATYFDLKLMIKEISPEGSSNKHAQQGAIAADALIGEIGKCCRDLFTSSHKNERKIPEMAVGKAFRLKHISNYWLMSPLIHACPKPVNLPSSFPAVTVQAKFLREAAAMLDTGGDNNRERIHQSAWLLSQEPFLNLILTCLKGEDQQRDGLVGSLLKQLLELAMKAKENPVLPYLRKFSLEREGLLLRLSLLGGMFDSVCHQSYCDAGAVLLFQLMLYGVISQERDRFLFESCFDMLSTLLVWSITDPMNAVPVNSQDPDTKYRFASYIGIVKKLRKELNERVLVPELRSLLQFLPISKPCTEIISCEPYGTIPMSPQKLSKGQMGSSPIKTNKQGLQFGEKVKIFSYDMVQNYSSEAAVKRSWNWAMFQAVKLDRSPIPLQKQIHRLIPHTHYNEFVRPTICGMDRPPNLDIYLSPPTMDLSETPVNVHHVSSASSVPTSTSAVTSSVAVSTGSIAMGTSGVMDMQATSTSNISTPQSRTLTFQPGGGQMQIPQNPGVDGMVFPGQGGIMSSVLEMNRNTSSSSPRGSRGGRRKATGTRGQGTQRKKAQRGAAAVAAQVDPVLTQSTSTAMSGQTMMSVGAGTSTGPYNWTGQPQPQTQMQPFAPNQQGGGMMVQPEDSKMKIHSMILKRQAQAASVTSAQGYQQINSSSGGQYAQMVVKMESGNMSMETQQSFQDQQAAQFSNQQRQYGMQQSTANVFESRQMMMGQQQQQVPYNQQQYPPF